ncbi:MAG: hypothetical protein QW489_02670 [Sulfolobales archaeon]
MNSLKVLKHGERAYSRCSENDFALCAIHTIWEKGGGVLMSDAVLNSVFTVSSTSTLRNLCPLVRRWVSSAYET